MDIKPTRTFELKFKDPSLKDQTYYSIRYEFNPNEYTTPEIKNSVKRKAINYKNIALMVYLVFH